MVTSEVEANIPLQLEQVVIEADVTVRTLVTMPMNVTTLVKLLAATLPLSVWPSSDMLALKAVDYFVNKRLQLMAVVEA